MPASERRVLPLRLRWSPAGCGFAQLRHTLEPRLKVVQTQSAQGRQAPPLLASPGVLEYPTPPSLLCPRWWGYEGQRLRRASWSVGVLDYWPPQALILQSAVLKSYSPTRLEIPSTCSVALTANTR